VVAAVVAAAAAATVAVVVAAAAVGENRSLDRDVTPERLSAAGDQPKPLSRACMKWPCKPMGLRRHAFCYAWKERVQYNLCASAKYEKPLESPALGG